MTPAVESWFEVWLGRHKQWNPGLGWNSYATDEDVFIPWAEAFGRNQVTEHEASAASKFMAEEESRYPEHHLPRLLALIRASRLGPVAPQSSALATLRAAAIPNDQEMAQVRADWALLPPAERQVYHAQVRQACPHIASRPLLVEALARTVWADGAAILDSWRLVEPLPPREPSRLAIAVPSPAALTAEQERIAIRAAAESRRVQLDRLRVIATPRTIAS